jgi:hypothetical protein
MPAAGHHGGGGGLDPTIQPSFHGGLGGTVADNFGSN